MKNNSYRLSDDQLLNVNGGVRIDFAELRKIKEKIEASSKNVALSWHWGDNWGDDGYWH